MTHDANALPREKSPGDPVTAEDGFLGCQSPEGEARVSLIPVAFDATCSSRTGAARGPEAILQGSVYLDINDRLFGRFDEIPVHLEEMPEWLPALSTNTRREVEPLRAHGPTGADASRIRGIDEACHRVHEHVYERCAAAIDAGRVPGVIGGEHGISFGAIRASAERAGPIGILHIDAHYDLRDRYLGLLYSHASVMFNAIRHDRVERLVSVGIRDWCPEEMELAERSGKVSTFFDDDLASRTLAGETWTAVCADIVRTLPGRVHISFDIDGLEPGLCPNTGTPVPGGLDFQRASQLLLAVVNSGKTIVGFDLVEVAPPPGADLEEARTLDGVVGARVLQRLIGAAARVRA